TGGDFDPNVWADDELWNKYLAKGQRLMCLMDATDQGAGYLMQDTRQPPSAASRWTTELETWHWDEEPLYADWDCDFEAKSLSTVFQALGINPYPAYDDDGEPADGENECYVVSHAEFGSGVPVRDQRYHVNGREYRATGAAYDFAVNQKDGLIVALNIMSPSAAVQNRFGWGRKAEPGELPELHRLSDIYWGFWFRGNNHLNAFKYYLAHHVVNPDTVKLITRALRNRRKFALTFWPGVAFTIGSPEHQAIIASPIGATAAHFLITHKPFLGIKRITKINVFHDDYRPDEVMLMFTIEDVPQD
ncbi:uncharacterized protein SETTUDRAFT_72231, partial [Exserohilum turcica Et28A]